MVYVFSWFFLLSSFWVNIANANSIKNNNNHQVVQLLPHQQRTINYLNNHPEKKVQG